jgi:TPP-dependent pyruvate/acetoin dehydrogenase alpha subunit
VTPDETELYIELYRRMLVIREFEDTVQSLFQKGHVHGTTHLYSGQEAGAVGMASVLEPVDRVAGTYRGHGHALALGTTPQALLDELLGRATGVCAGRAGSMNVVDLEHRLIGCFGIIGGSIGAATGAALALQRQTGVAVAFFGEGTSNHGYFHECLNFAKIEALPVVYFCENNVYSEFTPFEDVTAGELRQRPATLGIPTESIDGNDVWEVRRAAAEAAERTRSGAGPQFIESLTYRFVGHSKSDPGRYRKAGELDEWRKRDPLLLCRARLIDEYGVEESRLDEIAAGVSAELEQVAQQAMDAPFPDAHDALALMTEFAPSS